MLVYDGSELETVLVFDPNYKGDVNKPIDRDINKMPAYRDAIRDRRVVTYAGIVNSDKGQNDSGEVGAFPGIPGWDLPAAGLARMR